MFYIKSLPPTKAPAVTWTYTRLGYVIPKEETSIESLKEYFKNSTLNDNQIYETLKKDSRVIIESDTERFDRLKKEEIILKDADDYKLTEKTKKDDKKRKLDKKINDFNERKEEAIKTETKEDDIIIGKEEKELEVEIKEAENAT